MTITLSSGTVYTPVIPEEVDVTYTGQGLVLIDAKDENDEVTLMLFTRHARAIRDKLNALDLGD